MNPEGTGARGRLNRPAQHEGESRRRRRIRRRCAGQKTPAPNPENRAIPEPPGPRTWGGRARLIRGVLHQRWDPPGEA
eukprot:1856708-Alexandrium_andersonii.AAC.1